MNESLENDPRDPPEVYPLLFNAEITGYQNEQIYPRYCNAFCGVSETVVETHRKRSRRDPSASGVKVVYGNDHQHRDYP